MGSPERRPVRSPQRRLHALAALDRRAANTRHNSLPRPPSDEPESANEHPPVPHRAVTRALPDAAHDGDTRRTGGAIDTRGWTLGGFVLRAAGHPGRKQHRIGDREARRDGQAAPVVRLAFARIHHPRVLGVSLRLQD